MTIGVSDPVRLEKPGQAIKCVVWDLDHTVWDGGPVEDRDVRLRPGVVEHLKRLDALGILHSVASRNDPELALAKLREFGIEDMFRLSADRTGTPSRSRSVNGAKLNIGLDAFAFVDDQEFERDEVRHSLPQVMCIDAAGHRHRTAPC